MASAVVCPPLLPSDLILFSLVSKGLQSWELSNVICFWPLDLPDLGSGLWPAIASSVGELAVGCVMSVPATDEAEVGGDVRWSVCGWVPVDLDNVVVIAVGGADAPGRKFLLEGEAVVNLL